MARLSEVPEHAAQRALPSWLSAPHGHALDLRLLFPGAGLPEVAGCPQAQALEVAILEGRCQRLDGPQRICLDVGLDLFPALGELGAELLREQLTHAAVLGPGILDGFCHSLCAVGGDGDYGLDRVLHALDDLSAGGGGAARPPPAPPRPPASVSGWVAPLAPAPSGVLGPGTRETSLTDCSDALRDLLCSICRCGGDGLNVRENPRPPSDGWFR